MRKILGFVGLLAVLCGVSALSGCSNAPAQSASNTATFSWNAPATFVGGAAIPSTDAITYNLYVGSSGKGSEPTTATVTGVSSLTWVDPSTFAPGSIVCGFVRAQVNGVESANSNEACKTFPAVPNPPTNLTAQ